MCTVDNSGVFISPFFDIPLHNCIVFIHLKNTQKAHFLVRGKKGRGSSIPWALCTCLHRTKLDVLIFWWGGHFEYARSCFGNNWTSFCEAFWSDIHCPICDFQSSHDLMLKNPLFDRTNYLINFIYTAWNHNHSASVDFTICTVKDILCPEIRDSSEKKLAMLRKKTF